MRVKFAVGDTKKARQDVQKATKAILESKGRQIAANGRDQEAGAIDTGDRPRDLLDLLHRLARRHAECSDRHR